MGRPKREGIPEDIAKEVVDWISAGKTLRDYCRQDGKPARRTIDSWRKADEEFGARVAHARDAGFAELAESCVDISDNEAGDVQRDKLRIETRLKLLACWDPRRYGMKQKIEHEGGVSIEVTTGVPKHD